MKLNIIKTKGIYLFLSLIILITSIISVVPSAHAATSSKIKLYNFVKLVVEATDLKR